MSNSLQELLGERHAPPILLRTKLLHQDTGTTINLREYIRIHKSSVDLLKHYTDIMFKVTSTPAPVSDLLQDRLKMVSEDLDHYKLLSETNLELLKNLLSLVRPFYPWANLLVTHSDCARVAA